MVFDGVAGVEPQSETNWRYADGYNVPRMCFINKLDRMGADFWADVKSIHERLTKNAYPLQIPIGAEEKFKGIIDLLTRKAYLYHDEWGKEITEEEIPEELSKVAETARHVLIEAIVENDDTLMHQYLEGKEPALGELKAVLRKAVIQCKVIPILCGSALKNKGVQFLLDAIVEYLPSPLDVPDLVASDPKTGAAVSRKASDDEPFTALAFKVAADPYVGKLTFFRVYAGHLTAGSYVLNVSNGERERISRIVRLHANHREDVDEVFAGEIAAAVGLKNTSTGHTLCDPDHPILLESIVFPEPVISVAIEPKTKVDQEKMGIALQRLTEEDPTFRIRTDEETLETIISGMGELHLEIIVERMKREFSVGATVGKPQVAYKETIKEEAEGEGKYIRQTGGRGQYGHCCLRVAPQERGKGYEFIDEIKGAVIPREYIPAIEKGVKEALENGVVAGYPVIDLTVTVYDGSYHEVDSSEAAFKLAGSFAFQEACKRARPILLEPIMKVEVITPEEFLGEVIGDLNAKRGQIKEMRDRSGVKIIDALVPLAEMFGYATTLRSMTQGRASNTMEFSHYEEVPKQIAMAIQETRSGVKRRG